MPEDKIDAVANAVTELIRSVITEERTPDVGYMLRTSSLEKDLADKLRDLLGPSSAVVQGELSGLENEE